MGNFGTVQFCVIGGVEAVRDGRLITIDSAKQRALLAMLVIHANEVVSTDRLMDALWGESPPDGGVSIRPAAWPAGIRAQHQSETRLRLDPCLI